MWAFCSLLPHSNPYAVRPNRRGDSWHDRDRIHVTVRRDRALPERGGAGTSQDGTSKNWFKITVSVWGSGCARETGSWAQNEGFYFSHDKICFLHNQVSLLSSRTPKSRLRKGVGQAGCWGAGMGTPSKGKHENWLGGGVIPLNVSIWLKPSVGLRVP